MNAVEQAGPTTLVVGLGNPILGDDGVGWRVAESLRADLDDPDVEVLCLSLGGMALMEHLAGYRRCLIVDAVVSGAEIGAVQRMTAAEMADRSSHHTASVHDLSLTSALALGRQLGVYLPDEIQVIGIEAAPEFEFGETLSAAVARAIPEATRQIQAWLAA